FRSSQSLDVPPASGVISAAPVVPKSATRAWLLCVITTCCAACGNGRGAPARDAATDAPDAARDGAAGGDATDGPRDMAGESPPRGGDDSGPRGGGPPGAPAPRAQKP